jgi:iodotyrosine deiodinase
MPLPTVPFRMPPVSTPELALRLQRERELMAARRSVRAFATAPVPRSVIEDALAVAASAPSGAHRQPWHFVAISDPGIKARIRDAAEAEERRFYEERGVEEWLAALEPLGTDAVKAHLTDAPWLVVVFRRDFERDAAGARTPNYYVSESVGIAVGFLLSALHRAGLATLTHTPSPMGFLREICGRSVDEKPYVLIPVGWPDPECRVPDLARKPLDEVSTFLEQPGSPSER